MAAYRRFLDDYLSRNLGAIARQIRRSDPDTPLTYRNWTTMTSGHNDNTGYDIGAGAAHLDFFSPERYSPLVWPDNRAAGLITAYTRYRTGAKPVVWAEFGANIGANGGSPPSRAAQAGVCDSMMHQVADDGSNGASVWWWPGGPAPLDAADFGIIDPDGRRAPVPGRHNGTRASPRRRPIDLRPADFCKRDRDTDARGSYGFTSSGPLCTVRQADGRSSWQIRAQAPHIDHASDQVGNVRDGPGRSNSPMPKSRASRRPSLM